MTNSTGLTFRSYPYIPTLWRDQSGHLRWTLTTSNSAVLSALLAALITFTISRLLSILYTILYVSFLLRKTKTVADDQIAAIATNTYDPLSLLAYLVNFVVAVRKRAIASPIFRIMFCIGTVYFGIQVAILLNIGHLVVNGPVPISPGTCGIPNSDNTSIATLQGEANLGTWLSHSIVPVDQAATQFIGCTDDVTMISCPGPAGQTFTWEIVESEPSHCWFGPDNCYNGSRTISQRATIVPSDMGTLGKSRMSLTVMAECSHVNNSLFIKKGWDPNVNDSFTAYQFGTNPGYLDAGPFYENDTVVVYDEEINLWDTSYRLDIQEYDLFTNYNNWTPPAFLADHLDVPYLTDNLTASSTLYLIFNRLFAVDSVFPNDDPFFLTNASATSYNLYTFGQLVSTLACRDRFQLQINPPGVYMPSITNGTWIATGTWDLVYDAFNNSGAEIVNDADLEYDILLFLTGFDLSALNIIEQGLGGNVLNAQKTVLGSIQYGPPQNISTRTEFSRWFGVSMLYALNSADMLTSGTDNDWGFGISPLPDQTWFCDKTLRISSLHVSVYVRPLVLILICSMVVSITSYVLDPFLRYLGRVTGRSSPRLQRFQTAIITKNLHSLLQLHRVVVETTTGQKFRRMTEDIPALLGQNSRDAGIAPNYGVANVDKYDLRPTGYGDADFEDMDNRRLLSSSYRSKNPKLYTTTLPLSDLGEDGNSKFGGYHYEYS